MVQPMPETPSVAARSAARWAFRASILLICSLGAAPSYATWPPGFLKSISDKLDTEPPAQVVAELSASKNWDTLVAAIASGNTMAIAIVPRLAKGTDAGTSEDLTISLAEALPTKATGEVLLTLTPDRQSILSVDRVCSAPFIEDTARNQRTYKAAALKAVRAIYRTAPDLTLPGEFCIAELKKIRG